MTIQLTPEQEQLISQAIAAGLIRSADDALSAGMETIRQRLQAVAEKAMDADQWKAKLHAWIESHPTDTPLLSDEDISRDSIYGNRGL